MPLNINTFKTRTLTAIVFVLIMLAGLFLNQYTFIALFAIIMFGCLYEFVKIAKLINRKEYFLFLPIAFVYIILPVSMMINLGISNRNIAKSDVYSPLFPCLIIFSIWINDTMAYLVGSFIGKTPFSKISPKKTWEGTIGGALLCVLLIGFFANQFHLNEEIKSYQWYVVASICAVFGTLGDLFESKLKRMANIKDSGNFMPGHGGFLDRFDSMLLATPFVWIYIKFFL